MLLNRVISGIFFLTHFLSPSLVARDYHVSPRGDDSNPGTVRRPWRTLDQVGRTQLQPGDRVLLEGGLSFAGSLQLDARHSGSAGKPVVISSYGSGAAIVDGGNGNAVSVKGASHIRLANLKLRGSGRKSGNTESGLQVTESTGIEVDQVEVFGFRRSGIAIDGSRDVRITRVHAHNNGFAGISSGGAVSHNIYIGHCLAENNPGDPSVRKNHSGNGIVIGKARGALVEYSEARYNGWDMPWTGNGPVGIWTYQSDRVIIQYCVAHNNRSTGQDGGGFDLDGGVTNSILQYNYSHSNFGSGYLICQYETAGLFEKNVVRYNISQDDGLKDHDAGIYVWVGGAEMKSTLVHNNTIFNSKGSAVALSVSKKYADQLPDIPFYNNIFVSRGPQIRGAAQLGRFAGNLYWSVGERGFLVDDHKTFEEWVSKTGHEKHDGRIVGLFADPLLRKHGAGLLSDPQQLPTLAEYELLPGSPAAGAGLDLRRLFGIDPGRRDFYGTPLPAGRFDIGAYAGR
ncbi:MAG: right-handed parallel beta-helix repeat-containing protein [Bryobacteraceae bacterium]